MYRLLFSLVLRRLDPERAHHLAFAVIRLLPRLGPVRAIVGASTRPHPMLATRALGLDLPSPFGVAAGFDKNGEGIEGLGLLGFGHVEVGTVTAVPQPGNERPRLFRLLLDRAVVNRMGFNNSGAIAVAARIGEARDRAARFSSRRRRGDRPVIGGNIGKSRDVAVEDAIDDYVESTRHLAPVCDYLAVNVSSPNTPGLRGLQELDRLAPLLSAVKDAAVDTPVLVKIAPDLDDDAVRRIAGLAVELGLGGIIATNTTLARSGLRTPARVVDAAGAGGLSGPPLAARSLEVLRVIRSIVPPELCVISVGGVETAADVAARLEAGATLVQGYTAFLYRGPLWAREINRGLLTVRRPVRAAEDSRAG